MVLNNIIKRNKKTRIALALITLFIINLLIYQHLIKPEVINAQVTSITIGAVGDMNPTSNTSATSASGKNGAAVAAGLANGSLDAFLGLGDFQYDVGNCSSYVNYWNRLWSGTKSKLYWISAPNHDWEPGRNEDLDDFMNGQCAGDTVKSAINSQRGPISNGAPYSFDLGNWHFAMISTALWRYDTTKANQVTTWLDTDLAQAKAAGKHLAVAYHDPYYTSNTSSHSRETAVKPWIDIMDKHDVRLTLSGSQHNYERSCPVTKSDVCVPDNDPNGMTAFQVSTGGIGLRSFTSSPAYIVKRFSDTHGWIKLTLNPNGSFSWVFNPVQGSSTDSGSRPAPGGSTTPAPTSPLATPTPTRTPTPTIPPSPTTTSTSPTPVCTHIPTSNTSLTTSANFPVSTNYKVWSRIKGADMQNNSFYLKIDNTCPILVGDASSMPTNAWTWVDYKDGNVNSHIILSLTSGNHSITIIARDNDLDLDKLLLTANLSCIPTGTGDNCSTSPSPTVAVTGAPTPTRTPTPIPSPTLTNPPSPTSPVPTNTPTPPIGTNLITNGSFEDSGFPSPWIFKVTSGAAGTLTQDNNAPANGLFAANINITSANATQPWLVQLQQPGIALTAGKTYTITYFAKASIPRTIGAVLQQNLTPFSVLASSNPSLTTNWQEFSFNYTPAQSQANVFIGFNLAGATGNVFIDNVGIVDSTSTPSITPAPSLLGDANRDGNVDILDFNIWRDEFLEIKATKTSDFNNDGVADIIDFNIWKNHFN